MCVKLDLSDSCFHSNVYCSFMKQMAKHVISVCIFCLICATHTPCASHVTTRSALRLMEFDTPYKERTKLPPAIPGDTSHIREAARLLAKRDVTTQNSTNHSNSNSNISDSNISNDKSKVDLESNELNMAQYMKKLFNTYGNGDTMTLDGFERMMHRLGLMQELSIKLDNNLLEEKKIENVTTIINDRVNTQNSTCVQREEIVKVVKSSFQFNPTMDNNTFKWACPAILYSMISENCIHDDPKHFAPGHLDENGPGVDMTLMWWYSNGVVFLISACGVLGLAVIPIMQKRFYEQLLQFLVALAVGTLAGDALLHLLPHAMSPSHEHSGAGDHHGHGGNGNINMWKGCVAMMGLVFFFFMERMITIAAKWRKTRQLKDKLPKRLKVMNKEGSTQLTNASEKQCKHKYSSFPYCYDEIKMVDAPNEDHVFRLAGGTDSVESRNNTQTTTLDDLASNSDIHSYKNASILHCEDLETNQNLTECPNDITSVTCTGKNKMLDLENNKDDTDSVEYTVILREHEHRHHGHTHAHGHVHSAPKTMFSVAWMVIMGDGLHNFTDGMAIGAAFSNSLAGGLSTALAVFCHELPHELGDFAMLLKAGMSTKQALFYNLLSSVLCFLGNWVGLHLGNIESASSWVFAAAAGMFLYIALVDMIPELSSSHDGEGTLFKCFLHLAGLLLGFGIMTIIALYEYDLETVFLQG